MPQAAIIQHGNWPSFSGLVDEPNLKVRSCKGKPTREKKFVKGATTQCDERARYPNPSMTITMDADVTAKTGLGSLGVGQAVSGGLQNFQSVWREHNPSEGKTLLDDVEDSMEIEADVPLTTTLTFLHKPFITA
jgi:hypothetical protein